MVKTISIEGMHCEHCVKAVKDALAAVNGVDKVEVSLANNNAVVEGVVLENAVLQEAIEDIGFDVVAIA